MQIYNPLRWLWAAFRMVVVIIAVVIGIRLLPSIPWLHSRTTLRADLPVLVEEIRSLSRLETASFHGEKIVEARSEVEPIPTWLVGDQVLLAAHGIVTAGVDLSAIGPQDIHVEGNSVHVRLPHASIFSVRLDDRSYIYDHHTGIFSRTDPQLETQARQKAEDDLRAAAQANGLLSKAEANARTDIEQLLKGAGAKQIIFES